VSSDWQALSLFSGDFPKGDPRSIGHTRRHRRDWPWRSSQCAQAKLIISALDAAPGMTLRGTMRCTLLAAGSRTWMARRCAPCPKTNQRAVSAFVRPPSLAASRCCSDHMEQVEQDDHRDRNPEKPQKNSTHDCLRLVSPWRVN